MPTVATTTPDTLASVLAAKHGAAISKSDTNELANVARGIYVGGTGDLSVVMFGGETVIFKGVPAGTLLPICVKQVTAANTSATNMVALW